MPRAKTKYQQYENKLNRRMNKENQKTSQVKANKLLKLERAMFSKAEPDLNPDLKPHLKLPEPDGFCSRGVMPHQQNFVSIRLHKQTAVGLLLSLLMWQVCKADQALSMSSSGMCELSGLANALLDHCDKPLMHEAPLTTGYWIYNASGPFFGSKATSTLKKSHLPSTAAPPLAAYKPVLASFMADNSLAMGNEAIFRVINDGFFQVTVPSEFKPSIDIILKFLTSFSSTERYTTGFNQEHPDVVEEPIQGFMIDNKKPFPGEKIGKQQNQVWRLNLKRGPEHDFWKYFPQEVVHALEHYRDFKVRVFNDILNKIGINPELRKELTCGVSEALGDEYALFNDFRPGVEAQTGLKEHKDYGMITALLSPVYYDADVPARSGLQAMIDISASGKPQWIDVVPGENCLIFNFGSALEKALSQYPIEIPGFNPTTLKAAVHRVVFSDVRRASYANFGDPSLQCVMQTLKKVKDKQVLERGESYLAHCIEENTKLYE
jgi:hypothetical protein